jgi:hypothetical protein
MKRCFISLFVLGLALIVVGCGGGATGGGGDGGGTPSISGTVTNAVQSGTNIHFPGSPEAIATVSDVTVAAYSDPSYTTSVKSITVDCSGLIYGGPVNYSLTGLAENATYYLKAVQTMNITSPFTMTVTGTGTIEVALGTSEATGKDITLEASGSF